MKPSTQSDKELKRILDYDNNNTLSPNVIAEIQHLIAEETNTARIAGGIAELERLISWENPDTLDKHTIKDRLATLKANKEQS